MIARGRGGPVGGDDPVLDAALRTLSSETGGGAGSAWTVAHAAAHYAESLRQYAALRVGPDEAEARVRGLLAGAAEPPGEGPGPRARLFRALRAALPPGGGEGSLDALPFHRPRGRPAAYVEALRRYRRTRGAGADAEALELHVARGLSLPEVAHVLDAPPEDVRAALGAGLAHAEAIFGPAPPSRSGDVEGAVLEALALEPAARPAPPGLLSPGHVVGERYRLEARIGAGAFADVYRARDLDVPDHVVALKLFRAPAPDAEAARAALRELRHIAAVFHPSVVQFKDHGWHAGHFWFVMPFLRGETLEERIRRRRLDRREARAVFEPLADALAAMHELGVRHQDLKPSNVFLARLDHGREDGAGSALGHDVPLDRAHVLPVLLDFGVAARDAEVVLAGTPSYFAPEVAARFLGLPDPPPVSPKSDVFGLALTLRDALEPEAREEIVGGVVAAFVRDRARRPPAPPRGPGLAYLEPSFARWLALSPDARPGAGALARELAVLTRPEDRRAARARLLRWAIPLTVTLAAGFGSLVQMQRLEARRAQATAEEQRVVAARARQRAEDIRADLDVVEARRQALERDIARIEREYETSRLTRRELAARLAQTESDLDVLGQRFEAEQRRVRKAREELDAQAAALAARDETIEELRRMVGGLESTRDALAGERNEARARAERAEAALDEAGARIRALEASLAEARDALDVERRRARAAAAARPP